MAASALAPLAPLALLWAGGALFFFLDGRRRAAAGAAVALLAAATLALVYFLARAVEDGGSSVVTGRWPIGVGIRLRADASGLFFAAVSALTLSAALAYEAAHGLLTRTLPALVLLLGAGLTGLFLTGDLFSFYVFFEVSMVASFALASYGEEPSEVRAATIFAVVNLVGSAFFVGAVAAIYRTSGTLDMAEAAVSLRSERGPRTLVAALLFVAFGLKLGLFPLHFWLPAVYRDARPVVAAVLAAAVANIGSYGLLRFGLELFPAELAVFAPVLFALGALSVLYGGLLAASRRVPTEVLGYSAVGQVGYVLIALAVGGTTGVGAAVLYAGVNALNKLLLFLCCGARGAWVAGAFAVGAFSVAGMPPTPGFAGKLELFRMGVLAQRPWIPALVLIGGGLSFLYMFQAWQHEFLARERSGPPSPRTARALLVALAALLVALGAWPEPLIASSRSAAAALLGGPE